MQAQRTVSVSLHLLLLLVMNHGCGTMESEQCDAQGGQCDVHGKEEKSSTMWTMDKPLIKINGFQVGHVQELDIEGRKFTMTTRSLKPLVFEIPDFLTVAECDHIINLAKKEGLEESLTHKDPADKHGGQIIIRDVNRDKRLSPSEMALTIEDTYDIYLSDEDVLRMYKNLNIDRNKDDYLTPEELNFLQPSDLGHYLQTLAKEKPIKRSRMSKQVWLFPDSNRDDIFKDIQRRVQVLTKMPSILITKSDFQVVQYGPEGHYNAHHDSSPIKPEVPCCTRKTHNPCRICRFMTILFYLNDVEEGGGTAFPVADNSTLDNSVLREKHLINLQQHCSEANLLVPAKKGKAVMWYNHFIDNDTGYVGELDDFSWHGGCPVEKGQKWIANFWIKFTDDKHYDLSDEV